MCDIYNMAKEKCLRNQSEHYFLSQNENPIFQSGLILSIDQLSELLYYQAFLQPHPIEQLAIVVFLEQKPFTYL